MFKNLTEKDLQEGKEIAEIFASLPEEERMQAKIYAQALADRNEIMQNKVEKAG